MIGQFFQLNRDSSFIVRQVMYTSELDARFTVRDRAFLRHREVNWLRRLTKANKGHPYAISKWIIWTVTF